MVAFDACPPLIFARAEIFERDTPGPRSETALSVRNLRVRRGDRRILDGLTAHFSRGEVTVVVGRSGAGKTSLLHAMNGLLPPESGEILRQGAPLRDGADWARWRAQSATIFQDHALIGRLSALDNVLIGLADRRHPLSLWPWRRSQILRAAQALDDVGLLPRAFDRVEHLSGGERQRVGVARALIRKPKILFGDEPFSALDPPLAQKLGADLRALAQRDGVAVILVLHQIALARALADRIFALRDGKIFFDGPPQNFDAATEAALFSQTP